MQIPRLFLGLVVLTRLASSAPTSESAAVEVVQGAVDISAARVPDKYLSMIYAPPSNTLRTTIDTASLGICFQLPDSIAHKVTYIVQRKGVVCKYFDSDCRAHKYAISAKSGNKDFHFEVPSEYGSRVGVALCTTEDEATSALQDMSESDSVPAPGMIRICDFYRTPEGLGQVCYYIDAHRKCATFAPVAEKGSRKFTQAANSMCIYCHAQCSGERVLALFTTGAAPEDLPLLWAVQPLGAVICREEPSNSTKTIEPLPAEDLSVETDSVEARAVQAHAVEADGNEAEGPWPAGHVTVCVVQDGSQTQTRICGTFGALNRCQAIESPFRHNLVYIVQQPGAYCRYYSECGEKFLFNHHSRRSVWVIEGDEVKLVGGVYCGLKARRLDVHEVSPTACVKEAVTEGFVASSED
ncbi:hypothetical protein BDW02DRAFT_280505 [Decorospora gaudefroyi]|uniref:Apple domain-containing protein n=1 Tax=Decorospora gaudefroyi TaxID=184978 RepID=A0A6A5JV68_9PLEO|nr:hypothetical protein BDW02DRAFT_280505 [Decorospora gaudefroyi]